MSKRSGAVLVGCMALVAGLALSEGPGTNSTPVPIALADDVPRDLVLLARATWERFTGAFPAQGDCLAPVTVDGARGLDDRAAYDPNRRLVTVRFPGTAPNLEASLVHEFAHHLELGCPGQGPLRSEFRAAQGLAADAEWFEGATWEETPSEQFAEAVTMFVLGRRPGHLRTPVSASAVRAVRAWAEGGQVTHRP
ncbi:MAG: hypothetical protein ACRDKZ_15060 [Actinomycetota bacterium]